MKVHLILSVSFLFLCIQCKTPVPVPVEPQSPIDIKNDIGNLKRFAKHNEYVLNETSSEKRIVLLGNSITEVWANSNKKFFEKHNLVGRGISGQTSPQLLLRFYQDVVSLDPYAVVIHVGTNDIAENTGPYDQSYTMQNIITMVDIALANDIKVLLAAVVPTDIFPWRMELGNISQKVIDLNSRISQLSKDKNLAYIDYHTLLKNKDNGMDKHLANDGVHPTEEGYAIMSEALLKSIKAL